MCAVPGELGRILSARSDKDPVGEGGRKEGRTKEAWRRAQERQKGRKEKEKWGGGIRKKEGVKASSLVGENYCFFA